MNKLFSAVLLCVFSLGFSQFKIIEKPINYGPERERLSIEYLKERHGIYQNSAKINPVMVILHFTDGGTAQSNWSYFNNTTIENARQFNKKQSALNVSAHYIIDRDGTIYHLVDDNLLARHAIGLNYCAIGVENIGSTKNPLTQKQVEANAFLVRELAKKHPIKYLIGHQEYGVFRNSKLWKESDPKYFTGKNDPGKDFMVKVRNLVKDLNLKSVP